MYLKVFNDVVGIMQNDYAGCLDKQGWDRPRFYHEKISNLMFKNNLTPQKFADIVNDYLLDFKDQHMGFKVKSNKLKEPRSNGFEVRRYKSKLYVTKVTKENRLYLGESIVSLDGVPITSLVERHKRQLMELEAEREDWESIIRLYSECEVIDQEGNARTIQLKKYESGKYIPTYTLEHIDSDTLLLTLTDFANPDAISKLIKQNEQKLSSTTNLIIDVRVNYGGSDFSFFELLPYLFKTKPNLDQFNRDYAMEFNCTERNYQLVKKFMETQLSEFDDAQAHQYLEWFNATWKKNRGKGFVSFGGADTTPYPSGKEYPENIVVLTDVMCGSSGDVFAYICKMSSKVRMIGRPTAGLNDYSNLVTMEWNDFEFSYPTSRLKQIDYRDENFTHGIKPHLYVPWTPEHIEKDIDMDIAMNYIKNNE